MDLFPVGKICSFCGLVGTADTVFAGGLGAMMCRDCLERWHAVLERRERPEAPRAPWWDSMSDEEMLGTLPRICDTADQVEEFLRHWVGVLRRRGRSWNDIGQALGVSRQAAWLRFAKHVEHASSLDSSLDSGLGGGSTHAPEHPTGLDGERTGAAGATQQRV